jgi:Flp pilus assembly protein TadG
MHASISNFVVNRRQYLSIKYKIAPRFILATRGELGATLIESAIVTPILALLMFGVAQYGIMLAGYLSMINATSVAARAVSLDGAATGQVENVVRAALDPLIDPNNPNVSVVVSDKQNLGGFGDATRITIDYDMELFFPLVVPKAVNGKFKLSTTVITR